MEGITSGVYKGAGRGESCLVAGLTYHGKPIHIVCGGRIKFTC
jgi:hypothetical protein